VISNLATYVAVVGALLVAGALLFLIGEAIFGYKVKAENGWSFLPSERRWRQSVA